MEQLIFSKSNYKLLGLSCLTILTGFALMYVDGTENPDLFSRDIFDFQHITLAPMVLLLGYGIGLLAILKKPQEK